jgi:YVTN family beta-propeller protein
MKPLIALWIMTCFCSLAQADEAFITEQGADDVAVVDLATRQVVATIPVRGKPAGIAMSPDGTRAYVTSPEGKFVSVIDTEKRVVLQRFFMKDAPLGITIDKNGEFIYVAGFYNGEVFKMDTAKLEKGESPIVVKAAVQGTPTGLTLSSNGAWLFVARRDENQILILNSDILSFVAGIPVGQHPFGITADDSGLWAYSANVESDTVSVIDLLQKMVSGTVKTGKRPYFVVVANGKGFVSNQYAGTITVFDLETLAPIKEVPIGDYPEGMQLSFDGRHLYVANWDSNELCELDTETLNVTAKIQLGDGPRAFGTFLRKTP